MSAIVWPKALCRLASADFFNQPLTTEAVWKRNRYERRQARLALIDLVPLFPAKWA
jgi:hypothetical protein